MGGTLFIYAMLLRGGSIALVEGFDSERFWEGIRRTGTTVGMLLGVMAQFLLKRPPSPTDRDHPLRDRA